MGPMAILLCRVDERLIHGQVVVGWGGDLQPERVVVVSDVIAVNDFEKEIYGLGLPVECEGIFETVQGALQNWESWQLDEVRTFVLLPDIDTLYRLVASPTVRGTAINIGGLHAQEGRRKLLPFLHVTEAEIGQLREILDAGVTLTARELPGSRRVPVASLLDR